MAGSPGFCARRILSCGQSGGLELHSLSWTIPINRLNRLEKLGLSALASSSKDGQYLRYEITKVKDQLTEKRVVIDNALRSRRRFRR